ncbi:MAG TPA: hypothetical protein VHZ81_04675 [Galbitalea sp.]|jgi:hypothetical protein|nr:hypothetical protein [Galbitalea sp.]
MSVPTARASGVGTARGILLSQVIAILTGAVVVVASGLLGSAVRTQLARQDFDTVMSKVVAQVESDDDAHAALARIEGDGLASSAKSALAALTPCIGAAATSSTQDALIQLVGFDAQAGAPRDLLPMIDTPPSEASYLATAERLRRTLSDFRVQSAETRADAQANQIAEDEVSKNLDAIGASIGSSSSRLIAKDVYATKPVKDAYGSAVAKVSATTTAIAPELASHRTMKVTAGQSAALISALTQFASECKAVAVSSIANKPKPVRISRGTGSSGYPDWHQQFWLELVDVPNEFQLGLNVNSVASFGCNPTSLVAEGTTTGALGSFRTLNVAGSPPYFDIRERHISATAVQWAVVGCTKPR